MTYRSIFVHVDDSDQTDLRLDAATRLARHYPAELAGAYIVSTRDFTPTESALLPPDLVKARMGAVAQAQKEAEKYGVVSTPTFLIGETGKPLTKFDVNLDDAEAFKAAFDELLKP